MSIKPDDIVDYHSIIGGKITSRYHKVISTYVGYEQATAKISGKAGIVAMEALTLSDMDRLLVERATAIALLTEVIEFVDYRPDLWEKAESFLKEVNE